MTGDRQTQSSIPSVNREDDGYADASDAHSLDAAATQAAANLLNQQNATTNATASIDFALPATAATSTSTLNLPPPWSDGTSPSPSPSNSTSAPQFTAGQLQFRSNTIAPSPPLHHSPSVSPAPQHSELHSEAPPRYQPSPLSAAAGPFPSTAAHGGHRPLRVETDVHPGPPLRTDNFNGHHGALAAALSAASGSNRPSGLSLQHKTSSSSLKPVSRTPSFKTGYHGFGTASAASSTVASPIISAMGDVTPLPSPLLSGDSPGPWKRLGRSPPRDHYLVPPTSDSVLVTSNGESLAAAVAHQAKRKAYAGLSSGGHEGSGDQDDKQQLHTRNRSISEYIPDPMQIPKRMVTVSGSHIKSGTGADGVETSFEPHMRREPHLSEARGLTPIEKPPTPPPSESSLALNEPAAPAESRSGAAKKRHEYFEAHGRDDKKRRRWRAIKLLGQGTFSRVLLATSQMSASDDEDYDPSTGLLTPEPPPQYDRRTLVAVKVCEHGPKGGASEDRVEMSLKRELEIMQTIHHPSLVHLKAWNIEPTRAILVLSYCPGGDLFDVASTHRELLTPPLLRRIFAELVAAVRYLHERRIVHRDIKLENVLVNLPPSELANKSTDWATYPYSVATLTDLGLSRRVADDEKLETRCGSDDYAAPEVIMGQPYDGRATDAWSLGVLLYALLEGRLPFDPNPGMSDAHRMRSRTSHRIARVEWRWIEYAGDDGDHEGDVKKFEQRGLLGAMEITEALLKRARSRWSLDRVAEAEWVRGGVDVEGGIRFREEEEGEEVL